jgi:hypothetical protein
MISDETIQRSWNVFQREWSEQGKPMAWCRIEWELWMRNKRNSVCQIEKNTRGKKCDTPCGNCLSTFKR